MALMRDVFGKTLCPRALDAGYLGSVAKGGAPGNQGPGVARLMTRIDPTILGFRRFSLLRSLASLVDVFPSPRFRRLRVLDADAEDDSILLAVPDGVEVVLASGFPAASAREPYGPAFDPARSPFDEASFHVVLAGPSVTLREGAARTEALLGLLALTRDVLVLRLPPSGTVGELGSQMVAEFLRSLRGAEDAAARRALESLDPTPLHPAEIEELLEGRRACVHYLPAEDPVGGLVLGLVDEHFASLPDAGRLRQLLASFHNTALTEAGPRLGPLYEDLCLIFPGRRSVPGRLERLVESERRFRFRPGRTELAALQLVMQLEQLKRRREGGEARGGLDAPSGAASPAALDPAQLRELLDALEARAAEQLETRRRDQVLGEALQGELAGLRRDLGLAAEALQASRQEAASGRQRQEDEGRRASARLEDLGRGLERTARGLEGIGRLETSLEQATQGLAHRLERIESNAEQATRSVVGEQGELQALREALAEVREVLEGELAAERAEVARTRVALADHEDRLEAAGTREVALRGELEAAGARETALSGELEAARAREVSLRGELEAAGAREVSLRGELEAAGERADLLRGKLGPLVEALGGFRALLEAHPILRLYIMVKAGRVPGAGIPAANPADADAAAAGLD